MSSQMGPEILHRWVSASQKSSAVHKTPPRLKSYSYAVCLSAITRDGLKDKRLRVGQCARRRLDDWHKMIVLKVKCVGVSDIYGWGCKIQPTEYPSTHLPFSNMEENNPVSKIKVLSFLGAFMPWEGLGTKNTWLGWGEHCVLAQNTCFSRHKRTSNLMFLKISSGVTLTNIQTPPRTALAAYSPVTPPASPLQIRQS